MADNSAREKAIDKIYSLRQLAEHPNTPPHEAEAARLAIKRLQAKHDIKEPARVKEPRNPNWRPPTNPHSDMDEQARRAAASMRDFVEAMRRAERRKAQATQDAERTRREREAAQARFRERHANHDQYGRPKSNDPFDEALRRDGRTQAQKQADLNNAWGKQAEQRRRERQAGFKRCERPESFFDAGGEPRKRNAKPMQCDKCSWTLGVGEGMVWEIGGRQFARCCEARPGPRAKRW
jgi:hypothetical protein